MSNFANESLSEQELWDFALAQHPAYRDMMQDGELPEGVVTEDGNSVSPRGHLAMHVVVERQLRTNSPEGITAIFEDLLATGMDPHEVRHRVAEILEQELWEVIAEGHPVDNDRYLAQLRSLKETL